MVIHWFLLVYSIHNYHYTQIVMPKPPRVSKFPIGEKQELKDATLVDVIESKEPWAEYQLSDGSSIKIKSMLMEVWRVKDEYDNDGNPMYLLKSSNVMNITPADELKKKR